MHVLHRKARRGGNRIVDQDRPFGNARHAHPRLVELKPAAVVMPRQKIARVVADMKRKAEGGGNRIGGDVVMGRPDPARGEDVVIARPKRVQRSHDGILHVRHDPRLFQVDTLGRKLPRKVMHVRVAGAARKDLVPDDENGCRGVGHGVALRSSKL